MIREAWAYREIMPIIPLLDAGLTPQLQWLAVPTLEYWAAVRLPLSRIFDAKESR